MKLYKVNFYNVSATYVAAPDFATVAAKYHFAKSIEFVSDTIIIYNESILQPCPNPL